MLLLTAQNIFNHPTRGGIFVANERNHLRISLNRYALRDQVGLDHGFQAHRIVVISMASLR